MRFFKKRIKRRVHIKRTDLIIKRKHTNKVVSKKKQKIKSASTEFNPTRRRTAILLFKDVKCAKNELITEQKQIIKPLRITEKPARQKIRGGKTTFTKLSNMIKIV